MNADLSAELAAHAARLVVEEGLEYAAAKRRAARDAAGLRGGGRPELPSNERVEDAVREHIALFRADTQPAELAALRALALQWMRRLAPFRPHLGGAVWRGTATRLSAIHLDLYADDAKAPEIALINDGIGYDVADAGGSGRRGEPLAVLTLDAPCPALGERVAIHLTVRDHDDLRGALLPDAQGRTWRGDARALARLLDDEGAAP
jgi:hypothetical protein